MRENGCLSVSITGDSWDRIQTPQLNKTLIKTLMVTVDFFLSTCHHAMYSKTLAETSKSELIKVYEKIISNLISNSSIFTMKVFNIK